MMDQHWTKLKIQRRILFRFQRQINVISTWIYNVETTLILRWNVDSAWCILFLFPILLLSMGVLWFDVSMFYTCCWKFGENSFHLLRANYSFNCGSTCIVWFCWKWQLLNTIFMFPPFYRVKFWQIPQNASVMGFTLMKTLVLILQL